MQCCIKNFSYRASHLANDPFASFPQFPYGSPAELTLSKQIPGAGFAPVKHTHNVLHIYWTHRWSIDGCSSGSSRPAGGAVLTLSPQCDALLLVCLADAVVTVSIHTMTGVSVVQVDISGTVRIGACAKLWQITWVTGLTARSPCRLQLHNKHMTITEWSPFSQYKITVYFYLNLFMFLVLLLIHQFMLF